jgi:hypothetical protein
MRDAANMVGWAWVLATVPTSLWLGQAGAPCPPEGPPPGQGCLTVLIGPDYTLLALAVLGAVGMLLERAARPRLSGVIVGAAGLLAGSWAATHQFLGSAWHVPRMPVVLILSLPPLFVATERLTRAVRYQARASSAERTTCAHGVEGSDG